VTTLPHPNRSPAAQSPRAATPISAFHYELPAELIAQTPAPNRDQSRLLVLNRSTDTIAHRSFPDLTDCLRSGDLLVLNDTRVLRARLRGIKPPGGARIEILLGQRNDTNDWWCLLRPGKRVRAGTRIRIEPESLGVTAIVLEKDNQGLYRLAFSGIDNLLDFTDRVGEVPLPPYITRPPGASNPADIKRYQTVYARSPGAVAAPTAGLHFTPSLLTRLESLGVELCYLTLHVGLGTFAPIQSSTVETHVMHSERFDLDSRAAIQLNAARATRRRVVAVGTTTTRVLEHVATASQGDFAPVTGETSLFIHPPFRFRVVDALITNFHLPQSTLLMLVSAFADPGGLAGRDRILRAYAEAIQRRYRFFSYGDAMLVV
jgi:S-adenosylmethionine:tRNA ribosyltransferase-isomerase